ncbi:helix-turn-helix domain-containing protein [Glutamicibacter ardleyensis]|uniref:helix-turn-helix domain-containing protein n=1 Tax=Glutamicibacter ardleyensis TaxID=225894 RepID=UPI003FCEF948
MHARICAALHIHANTLYNRLERIDKLIGPGWKDSSRNLDLQLAMRLNQALMRHDQTVCRSRRLHPRFATRPARESRITPAAR